jgi:protein TonB
MSQTNKVVRSGSTDNGMVASTTALTRVFELGSEGRHTRSAVGVLATVLAHGGIAAAVFWCGDLAARGMTLAADEFTIEREPDKVEPPAPEPPPPPAPTAQPVPPPKPVPEEEQESEPAPEAAQAGALLTQEPDENAPDDYDDSFVTGDNDSYAGGMTASLGKSLEAVYGLGARAGGTPGGTGSAEPAKPATPDCSRLPTFGSNSMWDCGFPWEADRDRIDHALARIAVTVRPDGTAESVQVVFDPGHGFGRLAKSCAMKQHFDVGRDHNCRPATLTTEPFAVRFNRD